MHFKNPNDAIINGKISKVHQETNAIKDLTVGQNVTLGYEPVKGIFVDYKKLNARVNEILDELNCGFRSETRVMDLTAGEMQMMAITKALFHNSIVISLDEPTASLTELAGKGHIVAALGEEAGDVAYTAYFAKKSYIEENSDTIQKFTNAIYEGQKWVKSHSAREIAEVIIDFFPDTEIDLLERVIQSYIDIDAWNNTPEINEEAFNHLQEIMIEAGELSGKAPYDKIINNSYAEEAVK